MKTSNYNHSSFIFYSIKDRTNSLEAQPGPFIPFVIHFLLTLPSFRSSIPLPSWRPHFSTYRPLKPTTAPLSSITYLASRGLPTPYSPLSHFLPVGKTDGRGRFCGLATPRTHPPSITYPSNFVRKISKMDVSLIIVFILFNLSFFLLYIPLTIIDFLRLIFTVMDNFKTAPRYFYGLSPSQMDMFMTEDNPIARKSQSVTEVLISTV